MKNTKSLLSFLLCLLFTSILFSQGRSNLEILKNNEWKKNLSNYQNHTHFFQNQSKNLGLENAENMQLKKVVETKVDWKHFRYQQFFKGLPVLNGVYILHEKNGVLRKANGNILPNIRLNTTPSIQPNDALFAAKNHAIGLETNANQGITPQNLRLENIENTTPELVIADKFYPENSGNYVLAYRFDLDFNSFPHKHDEYLVDAHSGKVYSVIPQVCHLHVDGTVSTKYYGDRQVTIDSISETEYLLQDFSRGDGIITVSGLTGDVFSESDKYFDDYNLDKEDFAAGDAHWGATKYYDWLLNDFNWNGLDNQGHELRSIIHVIDGPFVNAFWNGEYASFGDGNCVDYGPLTTLDVVSHEFTHGLTEFTSSLIYAGESGALNESMSDMFGKALEWYENPADFTWELGRGFIKNTTADPFRNMENPTLLDHPKLYKGENWSTSNLVHTNSNVMNHWFYLLVEGGAATNEIGVDFNVQSIGMDKAMELVFGINTGYLMPNSNYLHAYHSTIEFATDIWGTNSVEFNSIIEAWKAVGIVVTDDYTLAKDLSIKLLNQDSIICGYEGELVISVEIKNLSIGNIPSGTEIPVSFQLNSFGGIITSSLVTEVIVLNQDFNSGDSIQYTFIEPMTFDEAIGFREYLAVFFGEAFDDENHFNDIDEKGVLITSSVGVDIRFSVGHNSAICEEPSQIQFRYFLHNEGCEVIPLGTVIPFDFNFNGVTTNHEIELPIDFLPDDFYSEIFEVNSISVPSGELTYIGTSLWPDENPDNNTRERERRFYWQTNADYFEDFTDFEIETDSFLLLNEGFRTVFQKATYEGEEWIGFTGEGSNSNEINVECQDIENLLGENSRFVSTAGFCVDLNGVINPTLSFDLAMFTVPNPNILLEEHTSVLNINVSEGGFELVSIYDQPDGQIITHNIPLPENYSGPIWMEFFTILGDTLLLEESRFEEGNVILLDNIHITYESVSTSQVIDNQNFKVFPNPASGMIWFENKSESISNFNIQIYNSLGMKIEEISAVSGKTNWQTNNQPAGVYFYSISSDDIFLESGKFILEK